MTEKSSWLAAIRGAGADRTVRLVYADYLDERADPRGELVRVCEAMRNTPLFADEYWRLKARRNELRAGCDPAWLAATGYDGSDYDPIFRDGVPDDWRGRWRLIREFTERWHGIPMPDIGGRADEVRAEEQQLGQILSPSVREWVAYALDVRGSPYGVPMRDGYDGLRSRPDTNTLQLLMQAEGDLIWAIPDDEVTADDPPVVLLYLDYESESPVFRGAEDGLWAPTVTGFCFGYIMAYLEHTVPASPVRWRSVPVDGPSWLVRLDTWDILEGIELLAARDTSGHPQAIQRSERYSWVPPTQPR